MRSSAERLRDMLDAIGRIERYAARGRAAFEADELIQTWCVHHLQIIGEAARTLPDTLRTQADTITWSEIIGMRHILVHNYFTIDTDIVWQAIEHDLPLLKAALQQLLQSLDDDTSSNP